VPRQKGNSSASLFGSGSDPIVFFPLLLFGSLFLDPFLFCSWVVNSSVSGGCVLLMPLFSLRASIISIAQVCRASGGQRLFHIFSV